ncbi:MAG: DUF4091 domain-containing protein, partial [Victivallaceae bacterium]
ETKIKITLQVRDFSLPKQNHLTCFATIRVKWFLPRYYGISFPNQLYSQIASFLLDYRIGPGTFHVIPGLVDINKKPLNFSLFDEATSSLLKKGMNEFAIGKNEFWRYNRENYNSLSNIYEHLREKGWLDKALAYLIDECQPTDYEAFKRAAEAIKKLCPGLKRVHTVLGAFPASIAGNEEIWGTNLSDWDRDQTIYNNEQKQGKKIWWFINKAALYPYPNWFINESAVNHRILFWMAWKYKIDGVCGWGADAWLKVTKNQGQTSFNNNYFYFGSPLGYAGNGSLYYPGPDKTQIPSIRLENIRDGLEDYEYFCVLKEQIKELEKRGNNKTLLDESVKVMDLISSLIITPKHYCRNIPKLYEVREKVASQIEKIKAFLQLTSVHNSTKEL